jgi:TM2 domain-containing membrane protein YozV
MPSTASSQAAIKEPFQPVAALLAAVLPGLGHFYLGQIRKGVLITVGVLGLFFTGLLIGGISCIDRRENFVWFLGQALVGPITLGLDYVHQNQMKVMGPDARGIVVLRSANPDETRDPQTGRAVEIQKNEQGRPVTDAQGRPVAKTPGGTTIDPAWPPYVKSLSRTNELGTLFTTIAGFMNVIVVIDAAFNYRVERRRRVVVRNDGVSRTLRAPGTGGGQ